TPARKRARRGLRPERTARAAQATTKSQDRVAIVASAAIYKVFQALLSNCADTPPAKLTCLMVSFNKYRDGATKPTSTGATPKAMAIQAAEPFNRVGRIGSER